MKKISLTLAVVMLMSMTACNNSPKKATETKEVASTEATVATKSLNTGTFEGIMPAADCEGIRTTLTVNADKTYSLKREYIGVENGIFESSGIYNQLKDGLIELITPSSGEKTYFIKVESGFMLTDSLGTINKGELAEHYILKPAK